jgi:hypothetical protein
MNNNHLKNEIGKAKQARKEEFFLKVLAGTTNLTEAQEDKIFEYAWDKGHSAGEYEVEGIFYDLVDLVEDCLK